MVTITADSVDDDTIVSFQEYTDSDIKRLETRYDFSKTLDGGNVLTHLGFSDGDRKMTIKGYLTKVKEDILQNIVENYTTHTVSTREGFFTGIIESVTMNYGEVTISFIVGNKTDVSD